ncbi:MAG: hypothetical protein D6698_13045 [Gammaproteobacteria bacterium]|nr:MAG: hypothetical protein D6698_13045 [Gammaproteobacteria bacterium]
MIRAGMKNHPSPPRRRGRQDLEGRPLARLLSGLVLFMGLVISSHALASGKHDDKGTGHASGSVAAVSKPAKVPWKGYIKRQWGVEVLYVRRTAAGYMLEFRYRVLDPKKAKPLIVRKTKPVMTHHESGAKLVVPAPETTGPMRNTFNQVAGQTYWMFFSNPAKLVKPGDHVDIRIGKFEVKGLVVQ